MKKLTLLLCAAFLAALLGGCILQPVETLYEVPQIPGEVRDLQQAIRAQMPPNAVYSPPTAGENQQAVQLIDLNGDSVDEAVAFLKSDALDAPLSVCVFEKTDAGYRMLARADFAGTGFDRVIYAKMDDSEGCELIVGRRLSDCVEQLVGVYTLQDGQLVELCSGAYAQMTTADLDEDGLQDLILLRDNGEKNAVAEYYHHADGQIVCERAAELSAPAENIRRIYAGTLEEGTAALFVASSDGQEQIVTDVFLYRETDFSNFCTDNSISNSVPMLRQYYLYGEDIDDDGLTELPRIVPMPELDGEESSQGHALICWYNLTTDAQEQIKNYTYHNYSGGWYLRVPEAWVGRLAVKREGFVGNALAYCFVRNSEGEEREIFSVAAVASSNAAELAEAEGWTILQRKDETCYVCRLEAGAGDCALTLEQLSQMFCLIRSEQNMFETDWMGIER